MKNLVKLAALFIVLFPTSSFSEDKIQYPLDIFSHYFSGPDAMNGWGENNISISAASDHVQITPAGGDAKIWRRLSLPKGRYSLSASTASDIRIQITADTWSPQANEVYLNDFQRGRNFKDYSVDFEFPGGSLLLIAQVPGTSNSKLRSIIITPSLSFTFVERNLNYLTENWQATRNNDLISHNSSLEIIANNFDSKIYRRDISLKAQNYIISAIGRNVNIELRSRWDTSPLAIIRLGSNAVDIRTAEFTIPAAGNYYLVIKVRGNVDTKGYIRGISIKPLLNYTFNSGSQGTKGWLVTGATLSTLPESIEIEALTGPSQGSKIKRKISLLPDEYIVTVTAKGNAGVRLGTQGDNSFIVKIISDHSNEWVTKSYYYKSSTNNPVALELFVHGTIGSIADIKQVRIEKAPITFYTAPVGLRGWVQAVGQDATNWAELKNTKANVVRLTHKPTQRAKLLADSGRIVDGSDIFAPDVLNAIIDDLEESVLLAQQNGIKVIIDLHQGPFNAGANKVKEQTSAFWSQPKLTENFVTYWSSVATRLSAYPDTVIAYDLFNEPIDWSNRPRIASQWRDIAQNIVNAIRNVDQNTWIIYQPGAGALDSGLEYTKPLADHKVIYSRHIYDPLPYTHQGLSHSLNPGTQSPTALNYPTAVWNKQFLENTLASSDKFQAKYQVPFFIGEFGVIKWAPGSELWLKDVVDLIEERGWYWTVHAWRQWQGWNLELNEARYISGDDPTIHFLPVGKTSARMDVITAGFRKNP